MIIKSNNSDYPLDSLEPFYKLMKSSPSPDTSFKENLPLWKQFFNSRHAIISQHILDNRLFEIIKFLLEQEKGEIFDYFPSDLLDCLIFYQNQLYSSIKRKNLNSDEEISLLFKNINNYEEICNFLETNPNIFNQDNFTKNSIYKYQRTPLITNTLISLIVTVNENFFELSPEVVKKTTKYIEKKLITISPNEKVKDLLYEEMFYQYITKIIPIKEFSGQDLKEDNIINAIFDCQIPNIKVIKKLLDTLEPENIMEICNNDIFRIIEFLNNLESMNKVQKQVIMNQIGTTLLTPEYFTDLVPLITNNCQNEYWVRYLTKDKFENIINYTLGYDTQHLSFETINYLLDKEYINELFLSNLIETLKSPKNHFSENNYLTLSTKVAEKLRKYNLLKNSNQPNNDINIFSYEQSLDFKTAIMLMDEYLSKKQKLTSKQVQAIIKSIIKNFAKTLEIEDMEVYFVKHQQYDGCYINDSKNSLSSQCININIDLLDKFLNNTTALIEKLHVLIVSLHEIRHAQKKKEKQNQSQIKDIETYEMLKEEVLNQYNPKYYKANYKYYQEEIDARIESYNMLAKFFETYLPQHLNHLQGSIRIMLLVEKKAKEDRLKKNQINIMDKKEVDFYLAFDTILKHNPDILKKLSIFRLEYNENGIPKSYEEILLSQNNQNKELIDQILKNRYPEIYSFELKQTHIK